MKRKPAVEQCPCGSGRSYAECCHLLHDGAAARDAEALMRSRYSAYVLGLGDYLLASWHSTTRPPDLDLKAGPKWLGLSVLRHETTGPDSASVEFVARYKAGGRAGRLGEVSRFERVDGRWYYLDGAVSE
ncbi:MAG: SEC-C domain-containing protein [Gammaproteobacteria bacterium]|nr:SEC-C domain-containing protein [Gammaproteobacteria bacterium]MBU1647317.1 SEC-C domain-containing protein [Gammaproteobacteria bacterium]MBU1973109.1 SEC-C domain-containing protein [Gammaproteobacteria bacterium]